MESRGKRGACCRLATWADTTQEVRLGCPATLPPGEESAPVHCYWCSWGGCLKGAGQHTAPPCPGGGGQGAPGGTRSLWKSWYFCLLRSHLLSLPKPSVPLFVLSPPPPLEKNFFWSMRLCLFCILSHLMFTWQLPPSKPTFLGRVPACAGARQKCLRTFLLPRPLNGCTDLKTLLSSPMKKGKLGVAE